MKIKFTLMLFVLGLGFAQAGVKEVGNGGDVVRFLFENGRLDAVSKINELRDCSFGSDVRAGVKEWIQKNKKLLASDVANSEHHWTAEEQATCASTSLISQASISLSYQHCDPKMSIQDAGKLLSHESIHHFDINDEAFADAVAIAIYHATPGKFCLNASLPEEKKWEARDQVKKLLPPINSNETGIYFGFDKDSGEDCSVLTQYGLIQNAGPNHMAIESFSVSVLSGHFSNTGSGLSLRVLANMDGSPYEPSYLFLLENNLGIFSMSYSAAPRNRSQLQIDYRNPNAIEVKLSDMLNPVKQISRICVIDN